MGRETRSRRCLTGAGLAGVGLLCLVGLAVLASAAGWIGAETVDEGSSLASSGYIYERSWTLPSVLPFAPLDVALDNDGRLYVADALNNLVQVFDQTGERVRLLPLPERVPAYPLPLVRTMEIGPENATEPETLYVIAGPVVRGMLGFNGDGALPLDGRAGLLRYSPLDDPTVGDVFYVLPGHAAAAIEMKVLTPAESWYRTFYFAGYYGDVVAIWGPRLGGPSLRFLTTHEAGIPRIAAWPDGLVALALGREEWLEYYDSPSGTLQARRPVTGLVPLAPVATGPSTLDVLVRPADDSATDAPHLVTLDRGGQQLGALHLAGVPHPPAGDWPWALGVKGDQLAFTTTDGGVFQVLHYDRSGRLLKRVYGAPWQEQFVPRAGTGEPQPGRPVALAGATDGLLALDGYGAQVVALTPGGEATVYRPGVAARDLAGDGQAVYVLTAGGQVARLADAGSGSQYAWQVECQCSSLSRLAAGGGRVYVSRPAAKDVRVLDGASGAEVDVIEQPAGRGLWPKDLAADEVGRLYTADLAGQAVQQWTAGGQLERTWPTGLAAGPRRIAVAEVAGEPAVAVLTDDGYLERYQVAEGRLVSRWAVVGPAGERYDPADVALDGQGGVYLAQEWGGAVHYYRYQERAVPSVAPLATATPHPTVEGTSCRVRGDKLAYPPRVVLGETAAVTISLRAECPGERVWRGADLMLVVDRSGSMAGPKLQRAVELAASLVTLADESQRLGLVSFADTAETQAPLGATPEEQVRQLSGLAAVGHTGIGTALKLAAEELVRDGAPDRMPIVVLVSDGIENVAPEAAEVASEVQQAGLQLYAVGIGQDANRELLAALASSAGHVYYEPSARQLVGLYRHVEELVNTAAAREWELRDEMGPEIRYVAQSARPAAVEMAGELRWYRSVLPAEGISLTYRIRPEATGWLATNRQAVAEYEDVDGQRRAYELPVPHIEVLAPTATPTVTPTREPRPAYLPVVLREEPCEPGQRAVDVVLVLDTSMSMAGAKLAAAQEAARVFVGAVDLAKDRVAVVALNERAEVAVGLTGDAEALAAAIGGLEAAPGTRLDRGVRRGQELLAVDGRSAATWALLLLTDGRQTVERQTAVAAGEGARAAGIALYAVGLGAQADLELLAQMVGDPTRLHVAPEPGALVAIYEAIARTLPCPVEQWWGGR